MYTLSDLWEFSPELFAEGLAELPTTYADIMTSSVFETHGRLEALASGVGDTTKMYFFSDITDQAEAIQVEGAAINVQGGDSSFANAVALNREIANGSTAMAKQLSGANALDHVLKFMALRRLKNRQLSFLSMLRAIHDETDGVLKANTITQFDEDGATPATSDLIDAAMMIDAAALGGELNMESPDTVLWMHPLIAAALRKQDENDFERTSEAGGLTINRYKGMPIYTSKNLARLGGTSGIVFDTYLLGSGLVGIGEKTQVVDQIDVASLQYDPNYSKNEDAIYDRTRHVQHIDGLQWAGTPAGSSPTNAELADPDNWGLGYDSAEQVNSACIKTNG